MQLSLMTVELRRAWRNRQLQVLFALTVALSVLSSPFGVSPLVSTFLLPIVVWISWGRDVTSGSLTQLVIGPIGRLELLVCRFTIFAAFVLAPLLSLIIFDTTPARTLMSLLVFSFDLTAITWLAITITRSLTAALLPAAFALVCGTDDNLAEKLVHTDVVAQFAIALAFTIAVGTMLLRRGTFCGGIYE